MWKKGGCKTISRRVIKVFAEHVVDGLLHTFCIIVSDEWRAGIRKK